MGFRLGNPARAYVLCTKNQHPRDDEMFTEFLDINDAVFDEDAVGIKIVDDPEEEWRKNTWP